MSPKEFREKYIPLAARCNAIAIPCGERSLTIARRTAQDDYLMVWGPDGSPRVANEVLFLWWNRPINIESMAIAMRPMLCQVYSKADAYYLTVHAFNSKSEWRDWCDTILPHIDHYGPRGWYAILQKDWTFRHGMQDLSGEHIKSES